MHTYFSNKTLLLNVLLTICNNFLEQNYLSKPVFNNVSRLNHYSTMNNAVTLTSVIRLGPQITLKRK